MRLNVPSSCFSRGKITAYQFRISMFLWQTSDRQSIDNLEEIHFLNDYSSLTYHQIKHLFLLEKQNKGRRNKSSSKKQQKHEHLVSELFLNVGVKIRPPVQLFYISLHLILSVRVCKRKLCANKISSVVERELEICT